MAPIRRKAGKRSQAEIVADALAERSTRQQGYRERALAIFPHICGRCGREFSGKRLRELTVHHKDHNHLNNPADGGNWELLCLYCHDDEHQKSATSGYHGAGTREQHADPSLGFRPFEGLGEALDIKGDDS
ncbi:MAG: YajD family HNH nuclease [Candidatus Hydrogenedentota bacterium]